MLVIDEAHRASGNYAYCNVIEALEARNVGFRILSLSATPVSKIENLQDIINSLRVSNLEVRDEDDEEVNQYTHDKDVQEVIIPMNDNVKEVSELLLQIAERYLMPYFQNIGMIPSNAQAKGMTVMKVLDLNK